MPRINAETVDAHREVTRQSLFAGAQDLFARHGYVETNLADIAAHAGIGRTTFYDYFAGKEDLLACLVEETLPEVFERMIGEIPGKLSNRQQLAALTVSMIEFVATDPVLGLVLHREVPRLSADTQERIGRSHRNLVGEFARIYQTGVEDGEFRSLPFDLAGHLMLDVVMSAARTLMASEDPKQRFPEVADETVAFLIGGLTA